MTQTIDYTALSDSQLVKETIRNIDCFEFLIKRYEEKLGRYIARISNFSKDTTQDILQEVFIKVYQNLNDFNANYSFSSWIYRIAHNEVIDHYRKYKVSHEILNIDDEENSKMVTLIQSEDDIKGEFEKKELKENINKVLNTLPNDYREILILRYIEDKDYKEICYILKKPMGTVSILLKRAKEKMKNELLKQNQKLSPKFKG